MIAKAREQRQHAEKLEEGDIFFFYRPKVEAGEVHGREDVQRFYMALAAERPKKTYRLFVLGRKKLPEVTSGQRPDRRNWALCVLVSSRREDIRRELAAARYSTKTRGERSVSAAEPIGEGRYQLLLHGDHSELAYALELPRVPGPAQEEFEIKDEASYVVAVKNPDVSTPGAPSPAEPPAYPPELRRKFGERRWIAVDDPALLDYANTQLLLLGAHEEDVETELGVHLDTEDETLATADVCRELRLGCDRERAKPLVTGVFRDAEGSPKEAGAGEAPRANGEFVCPYDEETFDTRSRFDRHMASSHPPSVVTAADVWKALAGIDFPASKEDLVRYAEGRLPPDAEVLRVIRALPARSYRDAADVAVAFGESRAPGGAPTAGVARDEPPSRHGGRA